MQCVAMTTVLTLHTYEDYLVLSEIINGNFYLFDFILSIQSNFIRLPSVQKGDVLSGHVSDPATDSYIAYDTVVISDTLRLQLA
jgi:hypothetical protein